MSERSGGMRRVITSEACGGVGEMKRVNGRETSEKRQVVRQLLCSAIAATLASVTAGEAYGIVQDFNRARGADGYTLTNASGDQTGTFDGQEHQPAPSSPGLSGEFWFAGAGL